MLFECLSVDIHSQVFLKYRPIGRMVNEGIYEEIRLNVNV